MIIFVKIRKIVKILCKWWGRNNKKIFFRLLRLTTPTLIMFNQHSVFWKFLSNNCTKFRQIWKLVKKVDLPSAPPTDSWRWLTLSEYCKNETFCVVSNFHSPFIVYVNPLIAFDAYMRSLTWCFLSNTLIIQNCIVMIF